MLGFFQPLGQQSSSEVTSAQMSRRTTVERPEPNSKAVACGPSNAPIFGVILHEGSGKTHMAGL